METEKEKWERRNKLFEEFKASPQYKAFEKSLQNRIKAIVEKSQLPVEAIQAKLEPIRREVEKLLAVVQQSLVYVQEKLDENEIRFNDAKEFYKRLEGEAPIPYADFWDWFFFVEHGESDETLVEVADRLRFIRTIDVKKATEWFEAEYRKNTQSEQLPKEPKPTPQALTFEGLFQFRPDFTRAMKLLETPLPDKSQAVKAENWVYTGKSEKALIVAFADVLKEKLSVPVSVSADDIAQAVAQYFGVELTDRAGRRARWNGGVRKKGEAYDYSEFRKHFLTKL